MNEFFTQNSAWISIAFFILSIPVGVMANLLTPKIKSWLAYRSVDSLQKQIQYLEERVALIDRLVKEPVFAVAKFTNIQLRAILGVVLLLMVMISMLAITVPLMLSIDTTILPVLKPSDLWPSTIIGALAGGLVTYGLSGYTLELYAMTHRVEQYTNWRKKAISEIEDLKRTHLKKKAEYRKAKKME